MKKCHPCFKLNFWYRWTLWTFGKWHYQTILQPWIPACPEFAISLLHLAWLRPRQIWWNFSLVTEMSSCSIHGCQELLAKPPDKFFSNQICPGFPSSTRPPSFWICTQAWTDWPSNIWKSGFPCSLIKIYSKSYA